MKMKIKMIIQNIKKKYIGQDKCKNKIYKNVTKTKMKNRKIQEKMNIKVKVTIKKVKKSYKG